MSVKIVPEIVFSEGDTQVPSKSLQYKTDEKGKIIEKIKPKTAKFEADLRKRLKGHVKNSKVFPIRDEVVLVITHGIHSEKKYKNLDLDNRAKTIGDALKESILEDDSQIKTLVCSKVFLRDVSKSYYSFSVKIYNKDVEDYINKMMGTFKNS